MKYIAFLAALIAALVLAPPAAAAADWAWPVRGDVVTPYKNGDDAYAGGQHRGIDIAAPLGARVDAAVGGRVTFAGVAGSSGLTVNVRTGDGRFDVSYLHLSTAAVHEGSELDRGDVLGAVGASGRRSTDQPHLHFGVREAGDDHAYRNPLDFLPPLAPPAPEPPAAAPVSAGDPVVAPPAAVPAEVAPRLAPAPLVPAPALTPVADPEEPLAVTTDALAPLPAATPVVTAASPGHTVRGDAAAVLVSADALAPGSGAPAARPAGRLPRHAAGATREHGSPSHRTIDPDAPSGDTRTDDRLVSRSDLGSPAKSSPADATHPQPRLHVADRTTARPKPATDGLNLGWLVAVIGLVTASLCLSRPQRARHAARSSRSAIGAVLRPLTGRG